MSKLKLTKTEGEGQGTCDRCGQLNWMCFLYHIEKQEGYYCYECATQIAENK